MLEIILENLVKILTAVVLMGISIGGAYLTNLLATKTKMQNVSNAIYEVCNMATMTAQELQQTVVERLRAANADGKLTGEDIAELNFMLLEKTKAKLTVPVYDLINAAGADIEQIIFGACEAWLNQSKQFRPILPAQPVSVEEACESCTVNLEE